MRLFLSLFLFLFNYSVFAAAPVSNWKSSNGLGTSSDPLQACISGYPYSSGLTSIIYDPHAVLKTSPTQYSCAAKKTTLSGYVTSPNYIVGYVNLIISCSDGSSPDISKPLAYQCSDPKPTCQDQAGNETGDMTITYSNASLSAIKSLIGQTTKFNVLDLLTGSKCEASGEISDCGLLGTKAFCTVKGGKLTGNPEFIQENQIGSAPTQCKKGQCPGQVNGVDVCVPCSSTAGDTGSNSSSSTTNSDGSSTKTESKSTTICEGDKCTTTTTTTNTTTNPDGSDGGTETKTDSKTESKETFCKENPTFSGCVPSGFSASTCDVAPTCTGDAIQCAIAAQQQRSYCDLMATPTPISELGTNAANGQLSPLDHPLNQSETSPFNFAGAFDTSGGGCCPADVSIMDVVVPLSKTCDGLNALGIAALGISIIWAARIVFAG